LREKERHRNILKNKEEKKTNDWPAERRGEPAKTFAGGGKGMKGVGEGFTIREMNDGFPWGKRMGHGSHEDWGRALKAGKKTEKRGCPEEKQKPENCLAHGKIAE